MARVTLFTLSNFEQDALSALMEFATIPSLSPSFDENWSLNGHLDDAAELLAQWARGRHLTDFDVAVHRLEGRTPTLVVTVGATCETAGTVVLYGHLDKQPPLGDWSEGLGPFTPVRRGDRLYARGVADDGYALFSALSALESMEANGVAHARCVVLIEASEESGSPDLEAYLDALRVELGEVDLLICLDSGALTYDRLWVTTSLRGVINLEVTVSVLTQGQHSGSVSGVVPSSFRVLRQLLDRVEDASTGRILVDEMYAEIPPIHRDAAGAIAQEFGDVAARDLPVVAGLELMGDSDADRILRSTWHPTLSLIGVGGVPTPETAGNVLRPYTSAVLSFRLPPTVEAARARARIEELLTRDPPSHAQVTVTGTHDADGWLAPPSERWLSDAVNRASTEAFGRPVGYTGVGGSIPFLASLASRYPGVQFVATGAAGPHSNAHAIDEMLDLPTMVGVTNAVTTILAAHAQRPGASTERQP